MFIMRSEENKIHKPSYGYDSNPTFSLGVDSLRCAPPPSLVVGAGFKPFPGQCYAGTQPAIVSSGQLKPLLT